MTYRPLITGFCLAGYRSFGPELQFLAPLGKINLLAGPNNSGKSNILRFITKHLKKAYGQKAEEFDERLDRPISSEPIPMDVGLALDVSDWMTKQTGLPPERQSAAHNLLRTKDLSKGFKNLAWFVRRAPQLNAPIKAAENYESIFQQFVELAPRISQNHLTHLRNELLKHEVDNREPPAKNIEVVLGHIAPFKSGPPPVAFIDAFRRVVSHDDKGKYDHSGMNLVNRLAELQNPEQHEQENKARFAGIERFLQNVMEDSSVKIEIPYSRGHILVHSAGKTLPLDSLGTGIHEVVILAAASTVLQNTIVCIEEPEVHLHPIYQRKLLQYLHNATENQYLIATHSPHLLDLQCGNVFQIALEDKWSRIRCVDSTGSRWDTCRLLGGRPSDVVQANCVIWVEGPSDRLYLVNWIKGFDSELNEGVHFLVLLYGGKLLSHFSAEAPEITGLIKMLAVNRHPAIIMDSDCRPGRDEINETKKRVAKEITDAGGFCWVTQGREIENYIDPVVMQATLDSLFGVGKHNAKNGLLDRVLSGKMSKSKPAIAESVTANNSLTLDRLDCASALGV